MDHLSGDDPTGRPPPAAADRRMTALLYPFADAAVVERIQRGHVRHFPGAKRVLDVGSGRGIFLRLLRAHGIEGVGIDANPDAAATVRADGFTVHEGDAVPVLGRLADLGERFDGVYCSHLVEHLAPGAMLDLVALVARVLRPAGTAMIVTPNPRCPEVIGHSFWLDLTHVRPYPREVLERAGEASGLVVAASYDDPATRNPEGFLRRTRRRVAAKILGFDPRPPMDSVVVLTRP